MRRVRLLVLAALLIGAGLAGATPPPRGEIPNPDGTVEIYDPTDGGWYNRVPPHLAEAVRGLIVAKQTRSDTLPRISPTYIGVGSCATGSCPTGGCGASVPAYLPAGACPNGTCPAARPAVIMPNVGNCPGGACPPSGYRVVR